MMFESLHEMARPFFQACSHLIISFFMARKIRLNIEELFVFTSSCSGRYSFPRVPAVPLDLSFCSAQSPKTLEIGGTKNGLAVVNWRTVGEEESSFKQCAR